MSNALMWLWVLALSVYAGHWCTHRYMIMNKIITVIITVKSNGAFCYWIKWVFQSWLIASLCFAANAVSCPIQVQWNFSSEFQCQFVLAAGSKQCFLGQKQHFYCRTHCSPCQVQVWQTLLWQARHIQLKHMLSLGQFAYHSWQFCQCLLMQLSCGTGCVYNQALMKMHCYTVYIAHAQCCSADIWTVALCDILTLWYCCWCKVIRPVFFLFFVENVEKPIHSLTHS